MASLIKVEKNHQLETSESCSRVSLLSAKLGYHQSWYRPAALTEANDGPDPANSW